MNINQVYGGDICRNHSARSEKEFCRVCPSNLNKKELENVYFTLLESNMGLKTTVNSQREKIKILSTKVQRLTALQKTYLGKEPKDCCGSRTLVNEQKECISELRRANQCLSERVRQLNMRLCSAKQFLKRSPFQSTSRCNRCSNKNASMSALITKRSETNLRTTAASSQCIVKDILSSRTADNNVILHEKGVQYDFCDENKCRNHIEELQKKNDDLEEELLRKKEEHATVTSQLEREVCELRAESVRVRSDRTLAADRADQLRAHCEDITAKLGNAELRCDELSVELAVERRKVAELETRLRAADMSSRVASAIETHLTNIKMTKDHTSILREIEASAHEKSETDDSNKFLTAESPLHKPKPAVRTKILRNHVDEVFKSPDDSGYTEVNRSQDVDDTKASTYVNQVLLEKIADLQNQINSLKAFKNNYNTPNDRLKITEDVNAEKTEILKHPDKHQIDDNVISESSESVITEKKVNTNNIATQQSQIGNNNDVDAKRKPDNPVSKLKERNKNEERQSDSNTETKLKESFKHFKRSKDLGHRSNIVIDSRKLSLQGSRDILKEKILVKTGSLDENRIGIVDNVNGGVKRFQPGVVRQGFDKRQIIKSSNDIIANVTMSDNPVKRTHNADKVENADNNTNSRMSDEKNKDSDSSKGTYTIKKDENELKLKTEPHDSCINQAADNEKYEISHTLADDVKKVLDSASKEVQKANLAHRRKSIPSEPRTYTKAPRDVSPDSTECEISSFSDLPSERDERASSSRSPGEERPLSTSQSRVSTTTTDYGSLSEGELPYARDSTILSDGEKRLSNRTGKSHSMPQLKATLAAVQQELTRCNRLLRSPHRSYDGPGGPGAT